MVPQSKLFRAAIGVALTLIFSLSAHAGLVGFYTLNGNANDTSGNGNNGTIHGSVTFTANGPFGGSAATFPGDNLGNKNDFITVPIDTRMITPTSQETFGAWFLTSSSADNTRIRGLISSDDGNFDPTIDIDVRTGFQYSGFIGGAVVGGGSAANSAWTFVAVSYNNNTSTYILQVGANQFTGSTLFDNSGVSGTTDLGINPNFDFEFNGEIADAFFYNSALTTSQLSNIQQNGPSAIIGTAGVPEPATFALLGGGLILLGAFRWKKHAGR